MSDLPRGMARLARALRRLGTSWRRCAGTVVLLLASLVVSGLVATGESSMIGPAMRGFVSGASSALMPRPARAVQASVATAAQDRAALEAFYHAAGGANWEAKSNWLTDAPLLTWWGVTTDDSGRVIRLNLRDNGLAGTISPELSTLTRLKELNLQDISIISGGNALSGQIPVELGNLVNLEVLHLGVNELTGPIPVELGNLVNLEGLYLYGNELAGPIPVELGNLVNLTDLQLSRNELTGPIPVELGNLVKLASLTLGSNPLTGTVPESLTKLSLDVFWIDGTGVCVPADARFQAWVATIRRFSGDTCRDGVLSWTDHRIVPGVTPVRAVHLMELRRQVDAARLRCGLGNLAWIDPEIRPGVTPIKAVHITQLRAAIDGVNRGCGQMRPAWTDPQIIAGVTPVRAVHFAELRDAVLALNDVPGANQAPEPVGTIPTQILTAGGNASRVDVAPYFRDPDDDPLTYSAISASSGIVAASTSGSIVTLAPVAAGTTTVGVTASDGNLGAMQTIAVTVETATPDHSGDFAFDKPCDLVQIDTWEDYNDIIIPTVNGPTQAPRFDIRYHCVERPGTAHRGTVMISAVLVVDGSIVGYGRYYKDYSTRGFSPRSWVCSGSIAEKPLLHGCQFYLMDYAETGPLDGVRESDEIRLPSGTPWQWLHEARFCLDYYDLNAKANPCFPGGEWDWPDYPTP